MATQTRPDLVVNSMNSWLTECANDRITQLTPGDATRSMLTASAERFASAGRFTVNDANYIRDCLILKRFTERVWKRADDASKSGIASEAERVMALFAAVNRQMTLLPEGDDRVPVGLYESLLTGRGTVEDRTWLFAEALRQRQIDAVLLECDEAHRADQSNGAVNPLDGANLLIAVLAQPSVLLFDPARATAVPAIDAAPGLVVESVGLKELFASDRWKNATVRLAAQPAVSAMRMLVLQENLKAEDAAMLYDELGGGDSEILPLRERVATALQGHWPAESIRVWSYPEQRIDIAGGLTEEQRQQYARLMKPFDAPFQRDPLKSGDSLDDIDLNQEGLTDEQKFQLMQQKLQQRLERMNESSEEIFGKASKRLLMVRIDQVMGDSDLGVIQQLQQIRIASMHDYVEIKVLTGPDPANVGLVQVPLPDAIRAIHQSATGDALYWSALCQIDRGDDGAAVITLRNYRTQYPDGSQFSASLIQESLALLRLGAADQAVEVLRTIDPDASPERQQVEWLLSRLEPVADTAAATEGDPVKADSQDESGAQP